MKKISLILSVCLTILLSPLASMAASHAWSSWYPVYQVYVKDDGAVFISLNPTSAHPNPNGCASQSWTKLEADQLIKDDVYRMILTAQAAGLEVNLLISGTECSGSYPKLISARTRS